MTREELFSVFKRPWRLSNTELGSIRDANDAVVLQVDPDREREDDDVHALAELTVDLVNEAEE
jgi:hypothetical protein